MTVAKVRGRATMFLSQVRTMLTVSRPTVLFAATLGFVIALPVAALSDPQIDGPAIAVQPAVRVLGPSGPDVDVVTIYNSGSLDREVERGALAASQATGGTGAIGRSASTGMRRVRRGGSVVQQAPSGYAYPMATTVLPAHAVANLMGNDVAAVLTATDIAMGQLTADLRGARAGDVVDLVASSGAVQQFTIAKVVPDEISGGTELLLSFEAAERLGITRDSRVVLWGFDSRASLDAELIKQNLISTSVRVRRSWDPPDPDATLGMAQTKAALGEFAYRVNWNGSLSIDSDWKNANISAGSIGQLSLRSGCHKIVRTALTNAMNEVIASGLQNTINYFHANTAGGCYVPRFNRLTPNSSIGFLSRHTWGQAVDTNTVGSCQGCAPPDFADPVRKPGGCDLVRIFRKHGFAWGGNFLTPDGMHFEWVGERRDVGLYPSRYCANTNAGSLTAIDGESERSTIFSDDGLYVGHH
jgi:hypothetical protein